MKQCVVIVFTIHLHTEFFCRLIHTYTPGLHTFYARAHFLTKFHRFCFKKKRVTIQFCS